MKRALAALLAALSAATGAGAEEAPSPRPSRLLRFLGGAATGFGAHEMGHVTLDLAFGTSPRVRGVDFHGIPFFAVSHEPLPPGEEYLVSSAGFAVQDATSEWLLSGDRPLREQEAPYKKGWLAFNVMASAAYAGAAFARTGPAERDTRGMAESAGIDEPWIGAMVLAPALLDSYRYFRPRSKWAPWASRAAKVGLVLLVIKAANRPPDARPTTVIPRP